MVCGLLLAATLAAQAEFPGATKPVTKEFEKMKSLVGTWQGKCDMGQGPVDMTVNFRLIAGGTVLEEKVFEGTPNEMVTMYYEKDGKLALTHYCVLGNRPAMQLKSSTDKTLVFDFDESCGIDPKKQSHMHALTIEFTDPNTITTKCKAIMDGKEMADNPTTLKRVKT
jgi:hypothetical protein